MDGLKRDGIIASIQVAGFNIASKLMTQHLTEDILTFKHAMKTLETSVITEVVRRTEGNKSLAASLLGISRQALIYKLKEIEHE